MASDRLTYLFVFTAGEVNSWASADNKREKYIYQGYKNSLTSQFLLNRHYYSAVYFPRVIAIVSELVSHVPTLGSLRI